MPSTPDSSARGFFYSSFAWLLVGVTALAFSGLKLIGPSLLQTQFLSYGRLRAVASVALVFGWLTQAALGSIYYLIPRLTGSRIRSESAGSLAGIVLNGALAVGVLLTIFTGVSGSEFLEVPRWLGTVLVFGLLVAAGNVVATLGGRVEERLYPSVWYLTGAAVWAPLGLAVGVLPSFSGTAGSIASLFSLNAYLILFLSMAGIGAIYYVIPRATGNPLYSYRLALIGFWLLAFAGPLAGQARAVFGPGQDWLETVGVASSIALLVPALALLVNVVGSMHGVWGSIADHPSIRFAIGGTVVWVIAVAQGAGQSLRSIAEIVGQSVAIPGQIWLLLIAMGLWSASAIVYAFPRLMGRMWAGRVQLTASFWATIAAATLIAAGTWGAAIASGAAYRTAVLLQDFASSGEGFDLITALTARFRLAYVAGFVVLAVAQWIFVLTVFRTTTVGELHAIEVVAVGEPS